jgi:endoglucanase
VTHPPAGALRAPVFLSRLALAGLLALLALTAIPRGPVAAAAPLAIRIVGNHFVDGNGQPVRLLGVNRSGTEYECISGKAIFDGPADSASVAAMAAWHINAVRIPLNEDCWLGINGVTEGSGGTDYRSAVGDYVRRLHAAGLYTIVDLHWSAQGNLRADGVTGQGRKMADRDHAISFWQSVASYFRNDPAMVFDLFNEPHDISWDCWQKGCTTSDGTGSFEAAGFQSILDAVRATGATNPVLVAGNHWAGDLRGWPHGLRDPAHQLAASWHVYSPGTRLDALRDLVVRPIAATYPVVAAELGEKDCAHRWLDGFLNWADGAGISYLAWTWDTWPDCGNPVLITSYQGTPTAYGAGYRDHLASLWRKHAATRVLTPIGAFAPLMAAIALAIVMALGFGALIAIFTLRRIRGPRTPDRVIPM